MPQPIALEALRLYRPKVPTDCKKIPLLGVDTESYRSSLLVLRRAPRETPPY